MRLNVMFREENETIKLTSKSLTEWMNVGFGEVQSIAGTSDYNQLRNKPSINSIVLEGSLTAEDLGLGRVYYDTKENWDTQRELIAEKGVVYIYSDYTYVKDQDGNDIPVAGVRIGDGTSYLIDMPFVSDAATYLITSHISNTAAHVSQADRDFWNNKVSAYMNRSDAECLELSKLYYEQNGEIVER